MRRYTELPQILSYHPRRLDLAAATDKALYHLSLEHLSLGAAIY